MLPPESCVWFGFVSFADWFEHERDEARHVKRNHFKFYSVIEDLNDDKPSLSWQTTTDEINNKKKEQFFFLFRMDLHQNELKPYKISRSH